MSGGLTKALTIANRSMFKTDIRNVTKENEDKFIVYSINYLKLIHFGGNILTNQNRDSCAQSVNNLEKMTSYQVLLS